MTTAIRTEFVQQTPGWIDARRDLVTASEMPIITGNTPYATSIFSLWAYKRRDLGIEPEPIDPETQEMFDLGHALEDDIADVYTSRTGRPLRRANRLLVHREFPWLGASLDRVSAVRGERRICEVKWVPHRSWINDGPEPVPAAVQDQVQAQLMVSGYDVADVAVLLGSKVYVYEIGPNDQYQADLLYIARWFRDLVDHGQPPPIDGSEATRHALTRLHPSVAIPDVLPPTAESDAVAEELRVARLLLKSAEKDEGRLANTLRSIIGDHQGVEGDTYRASWTKNQDSQKTDHAAVARQYRRLLEGINPIAIRDNDELAPEISRLPVSLGMTQLLDAIEGLHTTTKEGARVLRVRFKDEETGKWV